MNRLPHFPGKSLISFHTKSGSYLEDYTPLGSSGVIGGKKESRGTIGVKVGLSVLKFVLMLSRRMG